MSAMTPSTIIRLSNLSLIFSGCLSVLGIVAFEAGWLNGDVNTSSSTVTLSSKQNDESKLVQETLNNPVPCKVNVQIYSQQQTSPLMQVFELKDSRLKSIMN